MLMGDCGKESPSLPAPTFDVAGAKPAGVAMDAEVGEAEDDDDEETALLLLLLLPPPLFPWE